MNVYHLNLYISVYHFPLCYVIICYSIGIFRQTQLLQFSGGFIVYLATHTHTHIYIYIYIYTHAQIYNKTDGQKHGKSRPLDRIATHSGG
jgi:hypothetical protein